MIEVDPSSPQGRYILFRVQLISADPSVQIVRIIKSHSQFDYQYVNHMKIDCAIDATNYSQSSLEQLRNKNSQRFTFQAGYIKPSPSVNLSPSKIQSNISQQTNPNKRKFFLYKLAILQCMPIDKSGSSIFEKIQEFPAGIDTIYVSESKEQLNIYPHRYRVKDRSQCLLQYEVDFVTKGFLGMNKWDQNLIKCQNCQSGTAIHYCEQDKQVYCLKCFDQLHRSIRKKIHQPKPLNPFNSATSYCSYHTKQKVTHYCFDTQQLKCQLCNRNQKKQTEIMKLSDLQKELKRKEQKFLTETKSKTKQLITKIQQILTTLSKTYEKQKQELQDSFKIKLIKIKEEYDKKIKKSISFHTELKRKYDQLLWVQNFLNYCSNFLLVQDNIKMSNSFFRYLDKMDLGQYYQRVNRNIQQLK